MSQIDNRTLALRSVLTGTIASAVASSSVNMRKVRNEEITKSEALREIAKRTSQGAIATSAAVATAGYLTQKGSFLKALTTISIGMAGIYAIEVLGDKIDEQIASKTDSKRLNLEEN